MDRNAQMALESHGKLMELVGEGRQVPERRLDSEAELAAQGAWWICTKPAAGPRA